MGAKNQTKTVQSINISSRESLKIFNSTYDLFFKWYFFTEISFVFLVVFCHYLCAGGCLFKNNELVIAMY